MLFLPRFEILSFIVSEQGKLEIFISTMNGFNMEILSSCTVYDLSLERVSNIWKSIKL